MLILNQGSIRNVQGRHGFRSYCHVSLQQTKHELEKSVWGFLGVICKGHSSILCTLWDGILEMCKLAREI